jgi:hypothetical protein
VPNFPTISQGETPRKNARFPDGPTPCRTQGREFAARSISWRFFDVEIAFLFAGLPFVVIGVLIVIWEARARTGTVPVPATIIGFSTGARDGYYHCVAEYVGPDGVSRYVENAIGSSSPLGSVGDGLTVLVKASDPEKAVVRSALSYVLGIVIAAMGLASCVVFFATFRPTMFSIAGAAVVTGLTAHKVLGWKRGKTLSLQEWREKKKELSGRVYNDATKGEIRWADGEAVSAAVLKQRKTSRLAIPILLVAGIGLVVLGASLHQNTTAFLATAVPAAGRVVDLAVNHSSDSSTWSPVVEFEVGDRSYRFKDSIGSDPPSYRRGDAVRVLYDPDQPQRARIDRGRWNTAIPILIAAFGALLCSLGVWSAAQRRRAVAT